MSNTEKITSIVLIAREWFDRTYGNSYFSCDILLNGNSVHKIEFEYGYGNHYEDVAFDWLMANGYLPIARGKHEYRREYWERLGITYIASKTNVTRKRDM
jgi:hypothetical protein